MRSWLLLVPACLASEKTYVQMDVKNYGSVVIELEDSKVPTTVDNFLSYVDDEYYDELVFHRVIKGFMIQGGGYDRQYEKQPTNDPIPLEADRGLDNDKGTIAMARTGDPDSATSQFFINTVDNGSLDPGMGRDGYCAFGTVVEGMDVVERIEGVATGSRNGIHVVDGTVNCTLDAEVRAEHGSRAGARVHHSMMHRS